MSCVHRELNMLSGIRKDMRAKRKKGDVENNGCDVVDKYLFRGSIKAIEKCYEEFFNFLKFSSVFLQV